MSTAKKPRQIISDTPTTSTSSTSSIQPHVGYGKLIMFGEHFVVYRKPALVAALQAYTFCEVEFVEGWSCGLIVKDDREAVSERIEYLMNLPNQIYN
jgi:hypothetical protein